jgi:hypothetical protein
MKITELHLRKIVRQFLLSEAAKRPQDVPNDTVIICRQSPEIGGSASFKYMIRRQRPPVMGMVTWSDPGPDKPNVISTASADSGWGPLLYDIAIELSGDKGIMPDRFEVSEEARSVWNYYLRNRPDIESIQYDNLENELTPTPKDNVEQHSAEVDASTSPWHRSSLSKAYRRRDGRTPTVDALKSMDKIIILTYEDEEE